MKPEQEVIALVKRAYAKTNIEPRSNVYYDASSNCGCAVGVVRLAYHDPLKDGISENSTFMRLADGDYGETRYFMGGFDSAFRPAQHYEGWAEEQPLAWRIGRAVGLAVVPRRNRSNGDDQ